MIPVLRMGQNEKEYLFPDLSPQKKQEWASNIRLHNKTEKIYLNSHKEPC